jgi:lipoprotein-releasing system ATP-binding protein
LLEAVDLGKEYPTSGAPLSILSGVNLSLKRGDAVAVMGPSGSGKSTLLYLIGALEEPTSGSVTLDGRNPFTMSEAEQAAFRNKQIGFVFQDHCLLPQCTVLENVLIPTLVTGANGAVVDRAKRLLDQVGLSARLDHRPAELSGGEKQRVALARALINEPVLLLCDEPTGNLDHAAADNVAALLLELHARRQTILMIVTHSAELAAKVPRRFDLVDRRLREAA